MKRLDTMNSPIWSVPKAISPAILTYGFSGIRYVINPK